MGVLNLTPFHPAEQGTSAGIGMVSNLFQMLFKDKLEQKAAEEARQGLIQSQQVPETPEPANYKKPFPALSAAGIGTQPETNMPVAGEEGPERATLPSITNILQNTPEATATPTPPSPGLSAPEKFPLIGGMLQKTGLFKKTPEPAPSTAVPMPDYVPPEREYNEQVAREIPKGMPTDYYSKTALYGSTPTEQKMLGEALKEGLATGDMSTYLQLKAQSQKPSYRTLPTSEGYKTINQAETYAHGGDTGLSPVIHYQTKNVLLRADDPANPNPGKEGVYTVKVDPTKPEGGFTGIVAEVRDPIESAKIRAQSYMESRMQVVYDAANGYAPRLRSVDQIRREPDRWLPYVATQKALDKTALLGDMFGTIDKLREAISKTPEFDAGTATMVNEMLRHASDKNWFGAAVQNAIGKQFVSPEQADYIIALAQLRENSLAVRPILNAGPGSDQLRDAILATLPTAGTPNREYALKQLEAYENTLRRLSRGAARVQLNPEGRIGEHTATPPAPAAPAAPGAPAGPESGLAF